MMKKIKRAGEKKDRREERIYSFSGLLLSVSTLALVVFNFGCQPNRQIVNSGRISPTPVSTAATKKTSVEQEVRDMQTVDFDYILVLRRKDGGAFDSEDRKYLRQNTPPETNRFVSADDDKAFVIGSAFRLAPENIDALKQRFNVEDFSKPETKEKSNSQTNQANKAQNGNQASEPGRGPANR